MGNELIDGWILIGLDTSIPIYLVIYIHVATARMKKYNFLPLYVLKFICPFGWHPVKYVHYIGEEEDGGHN